MIVRAAAGALLCITAACSGSGFSAPTQQASTAPGRDTAMTPRIDMYATGFPMPAGLVEGQFLVVNNCLVFEMRHDGRQYRPVLPPASQIIAEADGRVAGVAMNGGRVVLGKFLTAGGGVAPWSGKPPASNCPTETIYIGKIVDGAAS